MFDIASGFYWRFHPARQRYAHIPLKALPGRLLNLNATHVDRIPIRERSEISNNPNRLNPSSSTILIVDDERLGRETLEALLLPEGHRLIFAHNGAEGLARAAELTPDLVLLDLMMPGMSGFEVCRALRASPGQTEVPVIIVTSLDDRASRLRGIKAGADDFITKPFDGVELRTRVRSILRLNRYRRLLDERRDAEEAQRRHTERYIALSVKLLEAQENERRSIARELHDEIGQTLTALKVVVKRAQAGPDEGQAVSLNEAEVLANELLGRVRELALDLRPQLLDDLGLLPALEWLFARQLARTQVQVDFKQVGLMHRLPAEVETTAYRIVQEALTNVTRHAGVSKVTVRLWLEDGTLAVQVEDRGKGFDMEAALGAAQSSGLSGMRERVGLLGGEFKIESAPGNGTSLLAHLPLAK